MVVIAYSALREFWGRHPDAEEPLKAWFAVAREADWDAPPAVQARFAKVSILRDGRAVFNIRGNEYRLVVYIRYVSRTVYIRFIGTHAEYDAIDAQEV